MNKVLPSPIKLAFAAVVVAASGQFAAAGDVPHIGRLVLLQAQYDPDAYDPYGQPRIRRGSRWQYESTTGRWIDRWAGHPDYGYRQPRHAQPDSEHHAYPGYGYGRGYGWRSHRYHAPGEGGAQRGTDGSPTK